MGYLSWLFALLYLLFTTTGTIPQEQPNLFLHNLFQAYATINLIFLVIIGFFFLIMLLSGEEEYAIAYGILLVFRVLLVIAAFVMLNNFTVEGVVQPFWFWLCFIFSLVFGSL